MTTTMHAATDVPTPYHLREREEITMWKTSLTLVPTIPVIFPDLVNAFPVTNSDEAHT